MGTTNCKAGAARRLIKGECRSFVAPVCLICLIYATAAAGAVAAAVISRKVIDTALKTEAGNFTARAAALLAVAAAEILLAYFGARLRAVTAARLETRLKSVLLRSYLDKDYQALCGIHSADVVNRLHGDVKTFASGFTGLPPAAVSAVIRLVLAGLVLITFNYKFAVAVVCLAVASATAGRFYAKRQKNLQIRIRQSDGEINALMQECAENAALIKTLPESSLFTDCADSKIKENYITRLKKINLSNLAGAGLAVVFTGGYYAALIWGAIKAGRGSLTYGALIAILQLLAQIRNPVVKISEIIPGFAATAASAERLYALELLPSEPVGAPCDKTAVYGSMIEIRGKNIKFSYGGRTVLTGGNFVIKKGEFTAVTGISGAGKTTVLELLAGLLSPASGELYIKTETGNIPINAQTRPLFAYIPQEKSIFSMTVRENLLAADKAASDEDMKKALETACVYDDITALPRGLDSSLGERGLGLSQGQLQRLSIARAVLGGSPVLLLDETTGALDETTERAVFHNIKALKDRTAVIVTHNQATAAICDRVINIENGIITENPPTVLNSRNC